MRKTLIERRKEELGLSGYRHWPPTGTPRRTKPKTSKKAIRKRRDRIAKRSRAINRRGK